MKISLLQALIGEISFQITTDNLTIRADQIRARLRLYPVMVFSQALLEPLFVWLFWEHANHANLLLWLSFFYLIHAADILLWLHYRDEISSIQQCKRWRLNFNIFTALTALMWGSISLLFFPPDLAYQALMICLVLGLAAGAVALDSVYPPALYIYILGVTLPLVIRLFITRDDAQTVLALMLVLFVYTSISAGREFSKTFWKTLWQRHENDFLIEQLIEQKAIAEAANSDKSRFLATASHDLRQPLQALVLFSEALLDVANEKETRHLAGQIGKSVGALVDMFDELLDISKLDAGVIQAVTGNFKVQTVFDRLQADFFPMALSKGVEFEIPNSEYIANSDSHLVERILRNLISNAIRYTDVGKVTVTCETTGNFLLFEVADTGIGIRAQNLPYIFEEYYQVDNQHRDRLKGLGLGLAIVRRMEFLLGCHVSVESEPGFGSIFSFSLPLGDIEHLQQFAMPTQTKHDLSGVTVALVDDNQDVREMAAKLMRQWGCVVYEGELPHEVLLTMVAANVCPDILICDYRLPLGLTAFDGIMQLREHWNKHIPTVVLTGDTAPQTLQDIHRSGALLLHKPIAPARLRSTMYFALNQVKAEIQAEIPPSKD